MAMVSGSISVNAETGEHSGSGAAYRMFDAWWTAVADNYSEQSTEVIVAVKEGIAPLFSAIAYGLIFEIVEEGEVSVTVATSAAGLQTLPDPPTAGSETTGPTAAKTLPGTIS